MKFLPLSDPRIQKPLADALVELYDTPEFEALARAIWEAAAMDQEATAERDARVDQAERLFAGGVTTP